MHLLVFDDEAAIGRLVVRVAVMAGLTAEAVTDAAAFERSLTAAPPRIIVLDLQLGGTDGVEQLRFLAARKYTGSIIVMSGFDPRVLDAASTVARNLDLNIVATLTKPIRITELEEILKRLRSVPRPVSAETLLVAIRNDELTLEFQPIVSRRPRTLKKLEALVRWNHPVLGRIPPADFLPVAEVEKEVIDALTDWVICAAVEAWRVLFDKGVHTPIAVNVSALNLHDLTFPDRVARWLADGGMPASQLCLEITETAASVDAARMMDILTRVRLKGMQLAIDDFGTGYSSLKALRQLPFSEIKIDQSFVADLTTSGDSRAIVKSIVDLAANMDMETVAEGVETEETARLLEQMNVSSLQGYLIAPSMPAEAVPRWLAEWRKGDQEVSPPPESAERSYALQRPAD
ncbi:MAG: EAL domain-containing response regulator [Acetobacteraceae bacterium]|jgi:EAL domain-containing protein (putative c-di-GMP-specific phosphodiesterase class I)